MLIMLRMRLPVWPFHSPLRTANAEGGHLVEDGVYVRDNILAVHDNGSIFWRSKRDVEHRTILCDVNLVAAKHRIDALSQARFFRQINQKLQRLVRDAILRIIQIDTAAIQRKLLAALRLVAEQISKCMGCNFL